MSISLFSSLNSPFKTGKYVANLREILNIPHTPPPGIVRAVRGAGLASPAVALDFSEVAFESFTNFGDEGGLFEASGLPSYKVDFSDLNNSACVAFDSDFTQDAFIADSNSLGDVTTESLAVFVVFSGDSSTATRNIVTKGNVTSQGWEIRILNDGRIVPEVQDASSFDAHTFAGNHYTGGVEWAGFCRDVGASTFTASTSINNEQSEALDATATISTDSPIEIGNGTLRRGFGDGTGLIRYLIIWKGSGAEGIRKTDFVTLFSRLEYQAKPNTSKRIVLIGDSTVHNTSTGEKGWGDSLIELIGENSVSTNKAVSGASSLDYEGMDEWAQAQNLLGPDTYLFIQFGHNDPGDTSPGTAPNYLGTYRDQLEVYIDAALAAGAVPVLITSVGRMLFESEYVTSDSHGDFIPSMKKLASDRGITLLDLEARSRSDYEALGQTATLSTYRYDDTTHFNPTGALLIAQAVVDLAKGTLDPNLSQMFK
jgi:lysophospholipase L1-like esterase